MTNTIVALLRATTKSEENCSLFGCKDRNGHVVDLEFWVYDHLSTSVNRKTYEHGKAGSIFYTPNCLDLFLNCVYLV